MGRAGRGRPRRDTNEGKGLIWALAASVGVHAILVLLSLLAPLSGPSNAEVQPQEDVLRFTFADDTPPEPVEGELKGDLPLATEPPADSELTPVQPAGLPEQPVRPSPQEQPQPQGVQLQPSDFDLPAPEPQEQQPVEVPDPLDPSPREQTDPVTEPKSETEPVELEPDPREQAIAEDPTGAELFEDDQADLRNAPERPDSSPSAEPEKQGSTLDVRRKLEDLRQQGLPPRPPSEPGKGDHGTVFIPDSSAMPAPGSPMGLLEFESGDYDWSDYYRQIYFAILRAWYQRIYAGDAEFNKWAWQQGSWLVDHRTKVKFTILRSGNVTGVAVEAQSGCRPLDVSATEALEAVILPRLPEDFPRDAETVHATFVMRMNVRQIRPWYMHLRSLGFL